MAIVKWRGWTPMWPSIFDDEDLKSLTNWQDFTTSGSGIDIYETDENLVVEAQIPGVKEEDVEVTVEGNVLMIRAESKEEEIKKELKKTVYKSSRQSQFSYSTNLPRMVDASLAKAEVENGVVTITIPKVEEEKPKKIVVTGKK